MFSFTFLHTEFGNTILHYACMNKRHAAEMIYCLLEHGASLETINQNGDTAEYCARKAGNTNAFDKASMLIRFFSVTKFILISLYSTKEMNFCGKKISPVLPET